jgi:hypothetical protein
MALADDIERLIREGRAAHRFSAMNRSVDRQVASEIDQIWNHLQGLTDAVVHLAEVIDQKD